MPITKFSWPALKENIRKFGVIYLVGIIIMLACSNLVWSMTRPRVPDEQSVTIYIATEYSNPEMLEPLAQHMLEEGKLYDETLEEVMFYSLSFTNPDQDYTGSMVLATRLATGEGDVYLCNEYSLENMQMGEAALDLQPYLDAGWLEGLDIVPYEMEHFERDENGDIIGTNGSYIGAIRLDNVDALYNCGAMENEGTYLVIACNGTNIDTTFKTVDIMMRKLMEE